MRKFSNYVIETKNLLSKKEQLEKLELNALIEEVKEVVSTKGYCVLRNTGLKNLNIDKKTVLSFFLSQMGSLTQHKTNSNMCDTESQFWDIKFRGEEYIKANQTTFSEQTGACPLHSDSSFISQPEDYLVMYVVKPAYKGGESLYLSYEAIINSLKNTQEGKKCLEILNENNYPFKTPKSFDENETVIFAKILDINNQTIRFRHDCIQKGMTTYEINNHSEMIWALEFLTSLINESKETQEFQAIEDDLIIIDNLRGLHARKPFSDIDRHYIRARVTKHDFS